MYLHAFSGSTESVKQLLGMKHIGGRFYFGFAATVNMRNLDKLKSILSYIPMDKLLLESDAESYEGIDEKLIAMANVIAVARDLSVNDVFAITNRNAQNFYSF